MTHLEAENALRFEKEMQVVMNNPVYKGRFSVDLVYITGSSGESTGLLSTRNKGKKQGKPL